MTPLKIEILLHYYYSASRDFPGINSPAAEEAIDDFVKAGLIVENPSGYSSRYSGNPEGLKVYVSALCRVPLPEHKWVISGGIPLSGAKGNTDSV